MYPTRTLIRYMYTHVQRSKAVLSLQLPILISFLILFNSYQAKGQCVYPNLSFTNPVLIGGIDGQIGAVYLFPGVGPGLDAHVEIIDLSPGAELGEIDNTAQGYNDAFQPYVTAEAMDTSYLEWVIRFKIAGTNTDTILPCLAVTGVDVDGDNVFLKEFIEAATPGAFAVDPFTSLEVSFDGVRTRAIGQLTTVPTIDTSQRHAMFQMNFTNVSTLHYRNGSISTKGTKDIRHTCIYFRPFFYNLVFLPVKLLSFKAFANQQSVLLSWVVSMETSIKNYVVQKSLDGRNWRDLSAVAVTAATGGTKKYSTRDLENNRGIQYYRLKQVEWNGEARYSRIEVLDCANVNKAIVTHATIFDQTLNMQIESEMKEQYSIEIFNMQGNKIKTATLQTNSGNGSINIFMPHGLSAGMYLLSVRDQLGHQIYNSKLIRK